MSLNNPLLLVHAGVLYSSGQKDGSLLSKTKDELTTVLQSYQGKGIYYSGRTDREDKKFISNFLRNSTYCYIAGIDIETKDNLVSNKITAAGSFLQASIIKCLLRKEQIQEIDIAGFYYGACVTSHAKYLQENLSDVSDETLCFLSEKTSQKKEECRKALEKNIKVTILKKYCRSPKGLPGA